MRSAAPTSLYRNRPVNESTGKQPKQQLRTQLSRTQHHEINLRPCSCFPRSLLQFPCDLHTLTLIFRIALQRLRNQFLPNIYFFRWLSALLMQSFPGGLWFFLVLCSLHFSIHISLFTFVSFVHHISFFLSATLLHVISVYFTLPHLPLILHWVLGCLATNRILPQFVCLTPYHCMYITSFACRKAQ